ncbi:restriction endonuclease [Streptomyces sp. NPDC050516]|uniref:restriction endonuclease n=1 Tax=Streptomyces sp. NPDC050516 TaxID=3365621 RepID=UPI0037944A7A
MPGYDGRDQPVTASLPDGRPVVFVPKHLPVVGHTDYRPPPLPALGLPEVRHLSDLARRHFPGAAIVVVTNGRFSPTAQRYAQAHDIQFIGREGLERWATWCSPLHAVLGSSETHTDADTIPVTHTDALRAPAPVYKNELLNEMLERRIAVADDEHLHAAVRWNTEDHLLEQALLVLRAHCDSLEREHRHAHRRAEHEPYFN